jgi:uncharacterized membrane protein
MLPLSGTKTENALTKERLQFLWGAVTVSVIFAGLFLRTYNLTLRSLWLDEALCVKIAATGDLAEMLSTVANDIHPPLFYILLHFWTLLFDNSDLSVRLFTVGWGCIGLFGIYFLCQYGLNWNQRSSNLATLFAIILPIHAYYSQEVRPYSMYFALSCFALAFLFRAILKMKMRFYILFGVFQGLVLYTHHTAIIYCFTVNVAYLFILLLYKQLNRIRIKGLLLSGFISFFLYLPWLPILLKQLHNPTLFSGFWFWVPQPSPKDLVYILAKIIGVWKLTLPVTIPKFLYLGFLTPIIILLLVGSFYAWKHQCVGESILCLSIWAYPLFVALLSHVVLPVMLLRILVPAAIGVPIIAALWARFDSLTPKQNKALRFVSAIYVCIGISTTFNLLHTYQKEDWKGVANFLSNSVKDGDSVLIYKEYYALPLERYIRPEIPVKQVHVVRESPNEDSSMKLLQQIRKLGDDSKTIYLVLSSSDVPTDRLISLMNATHDLDQRWFFYHIQILRFSPPHRSVEKT